ncbi:MAG: hypothetical protein U9R66_05170 [Thermodesulfobacteriota bacterium]|nr:hypothetical protein [Thermodesulfobacteriota bacterium]
MTFTQTIIQLFSDKQLRSLCALLFLSLLLPTLSRADLVDRLKEYPASMRCENIKVSILLRAMGRQSGINIFVADNIDNTISFEMEQLSLYDVFQLIIDTQELYFNEKNNVISVQKKVDFKEEQKDLTTEKICTNFGQADQHLKQLLPLKSELGTITVTSRNNCLLIRDRQENIHRISEMLKELDTPIPQLHIEARIVAVSDAAKQQLGVKWNYMNARDAEALAEKTNPVTFNSDLSIAGTTTNLTLGIIKDNINLNYELQALQEDDELEILSAPSVLVLDGKEAEIKQGQEVPYTAQSGDYINTSFREANLSLKVTPQILQNDLIILDVHVTNDHVDETNKVGEEPLINRQEITTNLYLENNVTVVIGGIKGNKSMEQISGIPLLKDIPLLGWLFKNRDKKGGNYELMIFLTPTIVTMNRARQYGTKADRYFQYKAEETGLQSFSSTYERPLDLKKDYFDIPDEAEK